MEDQMWDLADRANGDAVNCNIGKDPCVEGTKYNMKLVEVSAADEKKINTAVTAVVVADLEGDLQQGRSDLHGDVERDGRPCSRLQDRLKKR